MAKRRQGALGSSERTSTGCSGRGGATAAGRGAAAFLAFCASFLALQASHVLRRAPVVTKRENVVWAGVRPHVPQGSFSPTGARPPPGTGAGCQPPKGWVGALPLDR